MKKSGILPILLLLFVCGQRAAAQDSGAGAGLIIGSPTGISGKYWLNQKNAIDAGVGYSLVSGSEKFTMHVDYIYHIPGLIETKEDIPVYYGFGGRINAERHESASLGARGVIGAVWFIKKYPVDMFVEAAPVFNLLPETSLDFDIALGARYFFN